MKGIKRQRKTKKYKNFEKDRERFKKTNTKIIRQRNTKDHKEIMIQKR
jgi:hypothetical protein